MNKAVSGTILILCMLSPSPAQQQSGSSAEQLLAQPAVRKAVEVAKAEEARTLQDQLRLCEVPAPPFKEEKRGALLREIFQGLGLANVRVDRVGNVIGTRAGASARPNLVFSAHLDTVFPEGTDVRTSRTGAVLKGPGIGDDCRGLAVMISVIRALNQADVKTEGTITFVGTVGEEGLGDLRGVKNLFRESLKDSIDRFISVDGTGLDITHIGVGSLRYRIAYKGPGGHSYGAFGLANPIHALGRAMARISELQVPQTPKTTFNVGRIGGGTSVNSIPFEAWLEMDMRSADAASLKNLDERFKEALQQALADENRRWSDRGKLSMVVDLVGDRPPGRTPESAPIVQTALAINNALGFTGNLREGSTDSNVPMGLGIPAITIGGGGRGIGAHSPDETFDSTDSWKGTQRATLLAIALSKK